MDDSVKEAVLARMRKDPKLFNTQRRILTEGLRALGLKGDPAAVEFKLLDRTYCEDTGDLRLMRIANHMRDRSLWELSYHGMLSGKDVAADDVAREMGETPTYAGKVAKAMLAASGTKNRVYLMPGRDRMLEFLQEFGLTQAFLVDPNLGMVAQTLADFCRQFVHKEEECPSPTG